MRPGPRNDLTDVAGIAVGNAGDPRLKSGVTVVLPDQPAVAGVHVMGGAPGTRETDLLAPDKTVDAVHALVLSGGSAFGLDAAAGVMDGLAARGIGFEVGPARVPIVPAAILFDLLNGGEKAWTTNPYRALGSQALENAHHAALDLGSVGAGTGAIAGRLKGGLGSASLRLPSGITVASLVACNALGNATVGQDPQFWAAPFEWQDEFGGRGLPRQHPSTQSLFDTKLNAMTPQANTTIAVVATDAALTKPAATRLATAAHDGFARALMPAHTPMDGDLVFALATDNTEAAVTAETMIDICNAGAITMARAIARAIFSATPAPNDTVPTWQERFS